MDPIRFLLRRNFNGYLELDLQGRNLVSIPTSVFSYRTIQKLILHNNLLEYLPCDIGVLASLRVLQLQQNKLTSIPREMARCHQLRYLDLTNNRLYTLPNVVLSLKQLRILKVANNRIEDLPHPIGCLDKLNSLDFHGNKLWNLPNSASNLKKLKAMDLSQNFFEQIPQPVCSLYHIKLLNMSRNLLTYVVPCFDSMKNLQELNLSHNKLETVCLSISKLKNMKYLNISYNQLTAMPESLLQLPHLKILHAQGNYINHIPDGFANLIYLNLANNQMQNFSVGKMKNLQSLNVSNNKLNHLPHGFYTLKQLEHLIANDNEIKYIPYEVVGMKKLRTLDIANNRLTNVPPYLNQMINLEYFNVQGNSIERSGSVRERKPPVNEKRHFIKQHQANSAQKGSYETTSPESSWQYYERSSPPHSKTHTRVQYTKRKSTKNCMSQSDSLTRNIPSIQCNTTSDDGESTMKDPYSTYIPYHLMGSGTSQIWNDQCDSNYLAPNTMQNQRLFVSKGSKWLQAYTQEDTDIKPDTRQDFHTSDVTSGFDDEIATSIASEVPSVSSDPRLMTVCSWLETKPHKKDTQHDQWPTVQFDLQDNTPSCDCCYPNDRTINKQKPQGLVKVFKEIFSISSQGGHFVSSENSKISLHIPSHNLEQQLQVIMQVVSISEEAMHSAQMQDPLLSNVMSISAAVMLTPSTDIPFTIPIDICLPAPPALEEEASGCLHVLTARDDNTCTPFFRNYTLENGYITLQTYHLAGKVAVMTKSKCQYKACKCIETLLTQLLS